MRRCLAILLLLVLPFQFSWAAAGQYCEHETGAKANHFGHHPHEHRQPADASAEASKAKTSAVLDVFDCHLHGQCLAILTLAEAMPPVIATRATMRWTEVAAATPDLSPPERPQWPGHA